MAYSWVENQIKREAKTKNRELENMGGIWSTRGYGKMMENKRIWENYGEQEKMGE